MTGRLGKHGFTLLEILLSTMILTLGLVSIFALFPVGLHLTGEMIELTNSTALARSATAVMNANQVGRLIAQSYIYNYDGAVTPESGPWFFPGDPRFANVPVVRDPDYGNVANDAPFYSDFFNPSENAVIDSAAPIDSSYTWSAVVADVQFVTFNDNLPLPPAGPDNIPDEIVPYRDMTALMTEAQMAANGIDCVWLAAENRDNLLPFQSVCARRYDFAMMPRAPLLAPSDPSECFLALLDYDDGAGLSNHRWLADEDFPVPNTGAMYAEPITPVLASFSVLQGTAGRLAAQFVPVGGVNTAAMTVTAGNSVNDCNIGDFVYVFMPTRNNDASLSHDAQEFEIVAIPDATSLVLMNPPTDDPAKDPDLSNHPDVMDVYLSRVMCDWSVGANADVVARANGLMWPEALVGFSRVPFHIVAPTGEIYRLMGVEDNPGLAAGNRNWLRLDRDYDGPVPPSTQAHRVGRFFQPMFSAQISVYRNYEMNPGTPNDATFTRGSRVVTLAAGALVPGDGAYIRRVIQDAVVPPNPNPQARKVSRWYQVQASAPNAAGGTDLTCGAAYLDDGPPNGVPADDAIVSDYEITTNIVGTYEVSVSGF